MKILVVGKSGQLAQSVAVRAAGHRDFRVLFAGRPTLNLAKPSRFARAIRSAKTDSVINTAAYTAVDRAEQEPTVAWQINAEAAREGADAAAKVRIPLSGFLLTMCSAACPTGRGWRRFG